MFKKRFLILTLCGFIGLIFFLPNNSFAALGDYTGIAFSTGNNSTSKGVVFYNNHFYSIDNGADQVYEFDTSNVYTSVSFDISSSGATEATDITTYNDFFWITDNTDDEVYKYNPDGTYTGVHFDTAGSGSDNPAGITAYNNFFWIVDLTDDEVYKYNPDGTYTAVHFDTAASGNGNASAITTYNDFFWILDSTDLEVYKYDSAGAYTGTHFDTSSGGDDGITFYNDFFWIVDGSSDGTFSVVYKYDSTGVYTTESFDVKFDGGLAPFSIAVYNDFFWILKNGPTYEDEEGVVKYNPDGTYANFSFGIDQQGGSDFFPGGIVYYDGFFYIVPAEWFFAVYKYNLDGTYTTESFDTSISGNESPRGIATLNDFFWIIDDIDAEVYKYNPDGTYASFSFDTAGSGSDNPRGIFAYDNFFWITDDTDDQVYKYNSDGTYTGTSFDTAASGNDRPLGIVVYDGDFYITNTWNSKVYEYELPPTISEITPVTTPTTDASPNYTFITNEAGDITYGGSCTSLTTTAVVGTNTITFETLAIGSYADCTITVTDDTANISNILAVTTFTIEEEVVNHTSSGSNPNNHHSDPPYIPPTIEEDEDVATEPPLIPVIPDPVIPPPDVSIPSIDLIVPIIPVIPNPPVEEEVPITPPSTPEISTNGNNNENGFAPVSTVENFSLLDRVSILVKDPIGNLVSRSIALTGLAFGIFAALFSSIGSIADIGLNLLRLWSLFLYGVGLKKRNRPWGVVYDSVTKQPLDPVYVVLLDLKGEEIATSITDMDGRYGFLVEPGVYKIKVNKNNYTFPSEKLMGHTSDELYSDIYWGDYFEIKNQGEVIAKNIPMDPIGFNWNEFAKKEQGKMKYYHARDVVISRLSDIFSIVGFFTSFVILLVLPKPYNVIVFCLYIVLFTLRRTKLLRNKKGNVLNDKTGIPLSYGILRVYSIATGVEVAHRVLDKKGNYYLLISNGNYMVSLEKKNEDASYSRIFTSSKIEIKHGILKKKFRI